MRGGKRRPLLELVVKFRVTRAHRGYDALDGVEELVVLDRAELGQALVLVDEFGLGGARVELRLLEGLGALREERGDVAGVDALERADALHD